MNMGTTPVDVAKQSMIFRMYLRNTIYPKNQQLIQDSLYSNIPDAQDINYQPNMAEYQVRCNNKKSSPTEYGEYIENAIINTLHQIFPYCIVMDTDLSKDEKLYMQVIYLNIMNYMHMSAHLKMLYNVFYMQPSNSSRVVMVTL